MTNWYNLCLKIRKKSFLTLRNGLFFALSFLFNHWKSGIFEKIAEVIIWKWIRKSNYIVCFLLFRWFSLPNIFLMEKWSYIFFHKKIWQLHMWNMSTFFSLLSEAWYEAPFLGFLKMISPQIFPFFHYDANQQVPYKYLLAVCSFLLVACLFPHGKRFPIHPEQAAKQNNLLMLE